MSLTRRLVLWLLTGFATLAIADEPATKGSTLAITGATIRTLTDAGDFVGTIVIRNGKIVDVGPKAQVPAGAKSIDATGWVVTPGLIDAHGSLGLHPSSINESGRDGNLDILDAVDPFSDDWRDAARQGITAVYVQPGGGGNLGGSGAVLRVCPGESVDALVLRSPAGIQVTLGMPPPAPAVQTDVLNQFMGRRGGFPAVPQNQPAPAPAPSTTVTRYTQYEQVRSVFDAARSYGKEKPTKRDAPKELLLRAMKGEIPVRIEVYHDDDVQNAEKLIEEFGLVAVLERAERVKQIPGDFRASRTGLVLGSTSGVRLSADEKKLALDGRRIAIGTFGDQSRDTIGLRLHAAEAVAAGIPRDRVLKSLTSDAADLLGVGDKLGRIATGRQADLAIFAGDPLDPSTRVTMAISQGQFTCDRMAERSAKPRASRENRGGLDQGQAFSNSGARSGAGSARNSGPSSERPTFVTTEAATQQESALPAKLPSSYVLKTARLLAPSGEFVAGELRVVNGRVNASTGDDSNLPVFDLGDTPVTPGLVAAHVAMPGETAPDADSANLRAVDGLAPDDSHLRNCRDAGFLTVFASPAANNVIAGAIDAVRASDSISAPDIGLKFVLTASARNNERYPVSLAGQIELIESRLRGEPSTTNLFLPPALQNSILAQRDRAMEAVRDRRLSACFEAQTRTEVRAALRLIAEYKLRGVLVSPRDIDELADEIKQAGVAVIVGPTRPRDSERTRESLVALSAAGIPLAFGGEPGEMRTTAAWLANAGMAHSAARRALIGQPSEAIGLPAGAGRLANGDAADFVLWTGDPLDVGSRPAAVVVKGERIAIGASDDAPATDRRRPAAAPTRTGRRGR